MVGNGCCSAWSGICTRTLGRLSVPRATSCERASNLSSSWPGESSEKLPSMKKKLQWDRRSGRPKLARTCIQRGSSWTSPIFRDDARARSTGSTKWQAWQKWKRRRPRPRRAWAWGVGRGEFCDARRGRLVQSAQYVDRAARLMGCACVWLSPCCGVTPVNRNAGTPPTDTTCGRSRVLTVPLRPLV